MTSRDRLDNKSSELKKKHTEDKNEIPQLIEAFGNTLGIKKYSIGRKLYQRYKDTGNFSDSIRILKKLIKIDPSVLFLKKELKINQEKLKLLLSDLSNTESYYLKESNSSSRKNLPRKSSKILHVLNTSTPYLSNGYSMRSKYIVDCQVKLGINPIVITRPGFPNDFKKNQITAINDLLKEQNDGVLYYRPFPNMYMRNTPIKQYINKFSKQIQKVIDFHNPDIVHAASNYVIGLSALNAARKKNKPFIYEIRGFWELSKITKEPLFKNSEEFELTQKMETYLANEADRVIVISQGLQKELIKRGIDNSKITLIPNSVDCNLFKPLDCNIKLSKKYNLCNKFVIGYIGSIVQYEGLQNLLRVINELRKDGLNDVLLFLIGEGKYKSTLQQLSYSLDLDNMVIFKGKIPHKKVKDFYSLFDLCIFPRIKEEVTEIVTPLKPLEAMACGKAIIGSDVGGLKEIIIPDKNGLIYNNSLDDLCDKIKTLYYDKSLRTSLGLKARDWIEENRDINNIGKLYKKLYSERLERCNYE